MLNALENVELSFPMNHAVNLGIDGFHLVLFERISTFIKIMFQQPSRTPLRGFVGDQTDKVAEETSFRDVLIVNRRNHIL